MVNAISEIWTEKYRPGKFYEIVGQDNIIRRIESLTNALNIPHLLLAGPAGTGVREKVKNFARTKSLGNVFFKVIFLDEADALTPEAQQALRRTMENYSATCRFILSCNYSSKIIDPIQSRCAIFRFKLLEKKDIEKYLIRISEKENLTLNSEAAEIIYEGSEGDCRRATNLLQSTASVSPIITPELVSTMISTAKPKDIRIVLDYAVSGDFQKSREKLLDRMW